MFSRDNAIAHLYDDKGYTPSEAIALVDEMATFPESIQAAFERWIEGKEFGDLEIDDKKLSSLVEEFTSDQGTSWGFDIPTSLLIIGRRSLAFHDEAPSKVATVSLALDDENVENCELSVKLSKPYCILTAKSAHWEEKLYYGINVFDALCNFRKEIEPLGYRLLCNGSRVDAYPSSESLEADRGENVFIVRPGEPEDSKINLYPIFADADISQVGTLEEQLAYRSIYLGNNISDLPISCN